MVTTGSGVSTQCTAYRSGTLHRVYLVSTKLFVICLILNSPKSIMTLG